MSRDDLPKSGDSSPGEDSEGGASRSLDGLFAEFLADFEAGRAEGFEPWVKRHSQEEAELRERYCRLAEGPCPCR